MLDYNVVTLHDNTEYYISQIRLNTIFQTLADANKKNHQTLLRK
jgi:hypothetical protein